MGLYLEGIIDKNSRYIFDGIIDNLFYCCLKEKCQGTEYNEIVLYDDPNINKKLYISVAKNIKELLENNNIIPLFKKMCAKYPDLMCREYYNQDNSRKNLYGFKPNFIYSNGNYYIYNKYEFYSKNSGAKILNLKSINGIPIEEVVKRFNKLGLNNEEINIALSGTGLFKYIDIYDEEINYEVEVDNKTYNLKVDKYTGFYFDYNILRKKGDIIQENYDLLPKTYLKSNDITIDNYSYSTYIKCLMILNGLSSKKSDKELFSNLFSVGIDSYIKDDNQINTMILISFLIENLEKIENTVPENIQKIIAEDLFYYIDVAGYYKNDIEKKYSMKPYKLVNENKFNAKEFLKSIKNCLAHFSYDIDEDNKNIILHGVNILGIYQDLHVPTNSFLNRFNEILSQTYLYDSIPIIFEDRPLVYQEKRNSFLILKDVELYLNSLSYSTNEEFIFNADMYVDVFALRLLDDLRDDLKRTHNIKEYDPINKTFIFKNFIDMYKINFSLKVLEDETKLYILNIIQSSTTFFKLDIYGQINYINELIRYKISGYKINNKIINDLIRVEDKSIGDIEYIFKNENPLEKEQVIRIIIKTIMYCLYLITNSKYEDYEGFEVNYMDIQELNGIDYGFERMPYVNNKIQLESQLNNLYEEINKISVAIENCKKQIKNPKTPGYIKEKIKIRINQYERLLKDNSYKEKIDKLRQEISIIDNIIKSIDNNTYKMDSHNVIRHIRNAISHSNIDIKDIDINNIINTKIIIDDYDNIKKRQTFHCETTLEELLKYINNPTFLNSVFMKKHKNK